MYMCSTEMSYLVCQGMPLNNDSAYPAKLPRWLSWCLVRRTLRVQIPPEAALPFLLRKKNSLSLGVVTCLCLVSMTEHTMYMYMYMYMYVTHDVCAHVEGIPA